MQQFLSNDLIGWYITLAVAFNMLSLLWLELAGKGFSPTEPQTGVIMMVLLYCAFILHESMSPLAALTILVSFAFLIGRFGIIRHVVGYSKEDYLSRSTWCIAIAINIFGLGVILTTIAQMLTTIR